MDPGHPSRTRLPGARSPVLDDHTSLKDAARALREGYRKLGDSDETSDAELLALFNGFARRVLAHFALEEGGGYFGSLAKTAPPKLVEQIGHLKGEHDAMTAELARLHATADTRPRRREFTILLERFLDRFEAHELHEDVVMEKLFLPKTNAETNADG
jgi:hypothetical protein